MGYVHDTNMAQFIQPGDFEISAGTWTMTVASNVTSRDRTAAAAAFTAMIPIRLPSNASAMKGAQLKSIDVWYSIGTAAATNFATVNLDRMVLGADDVLPVGAAVPITLDAGHDTAAERFAVDNDHCMTVFLNSPAWLDDGDIFWLQLIVDCAASTVFRFFGARANYTLRI